MVDTLFRDVNGVLKSTLISIDALVFLQQEIQFREDMIVRELNKAWCGFFGHKEAAIATGNILPAVLDFLLN